MSSGRDLRGVLGDLSLLYELSLSVGTSLDLEENCARFLGTLMARMDLSLAAVWLRDGADAGGGMSLAWCQPRFRRTQTQVAAHHAMETCLADADFVSIAATEPGFSALMTERVVPGGCFALFRLGDLGVLKLHAATRTGPLPHRELNRLRNVVGKFTVSLEGCLAHQQATRELARRVEAEAALRTTEARYRAIFQGSPSALFLLDTAGAIQAVNPSGAELLGWSLDELVGRSVFDLSHPDSRDDARGYFAEVLRGEASRESRRQRKLLADGSVCWTGEVARRVEGADGPQVLMSWHDITAAVQAEEVSRQIEGRLIEAQKLESLGLMAGGVAHDFNNILAGIIGNADLALLELPQDASARTYIQEVGLAGSKAADLCRQLLAYSGRGRFDVRVVNLSTEVADARVLVDMTVGRSSRVAYRLVPGLPSVRADVNQLRQIVLNLILNAVEAVADGGQVTVRTRACATLPPGLSDPRPPAERTRGFVVLEVADTGCGMDEKTLARVFDPFFSTKFTGHGLGLAGVQGIVRGHDGVIDVQSQPGEGSRFSVYLPISSQPVRHEAPPQLRLGFDPGGKVLLVDDEPLVMTTGQALLRHLGFEVLTAASGPEALSRHSQNLGLRAVVLDVTMPDMDGVQVLHRLRSRQPDLPILLCSGYSEGADIEEAAALPGVHFLPKPYTLKALRQGLAALLGGD